VAISLENLKEFLVQSLVGCSAGEVALGDMIEKGKVGGRIVVGSRFSRIL